MSSRHHKPSHKEHEPLDGKDNREAQGQKNYKKIHRPDLPIIDLSSGPNISHIREAITQYCQRELGPISNIFLEGRYRAPATATYDLVEIAADSSGLKKDQASTRIKRADADNDKYEKSKMKLHGVLSGMTTREVDDKVAAHRDSLKSAQSEAQTRVGQIAQMPTALQLEETAHREAEELSCPLALWKCIVHVTTTRTIGNTRIDQNNLLINFANIRQRPNESVSDFKRRISNLLDSFEATKMERPQDSAIAMRFLHGLEDSRYGTLKTWLGNELANGRDAYPLDLDSAAGQATKWLVNSARNTPTNTAPHGVTTFLADATSPRRRDKKAPHDETRYDAPANSEHCTFCNNSGHSIEKCFKMAAASKLATQETADKKVKYSKGKLSPPTGAMLATVDEDLDMDIPLHKIAYHSISFIIGHAKSLSSYDLILDTGANGSIVHNKALLHSIEDSPPMSFSGIAGTLQTTTAGTIRDLGTARYHPKSPANILSFSEMRAAGHKITFRRTNNIDTFTVATKTQKYLFKQRVTGLYVCDLTPINHTFIATVQDNEALHSKREVTQAAAARELQERLAHPPDARLAQALSYGNIIYSKVSPADIIRAHSIYGPNTSGLKGRTVHRTAEAFPSPQESLRDTTPQQLYADIFIANGLSFFITVAKPLEHLIATPIDSRDTGSLRRAVKHHLSFYSQRRIPTPIIYSDNERGLAAVGPDLAAIHVQLVHSGPGMHVHVVERAIRYIKEGVRSTHAGLPYNCPRAIFRLMIPFVASRLNMFPSSTRTDHLSAFQIVHNRPADARRDCHLAFGAMYHVTNRERAHTMTPRTVAAIGVAQVPNGTGTCAFFAIHNHQIIKANHFSAVPLTPDMIAHMNRLAADDKVATAIDIPYYIHGKALSQTDTPTHSPSREPTTAIAPALTDELPDTTVHNEEEQPEVPMVPNEVALETAAPLSDYSVAEPATTPSASSHTSDPTPRVEDTDISTLETDSYPDEALPSTPEDNPSTPSTNTAPPVPYSRPTRERRPPDRLTMYNVFHITAKRALREDPATARPAIEAELKTLIAKGVFRPVLTSSLTPTQRTNIIRSQLNITQKYLPTTDGTGRVKDKVKARLVGGGDCQDRTQYTAAETSSPTISTTSIFLLCQIAARETRDIATVDIGSAYLNASMPKTNPAKLVFMRISSEVSNIMCSIDDTFLPFKHADGTLVVELDKALYGCIESALLWYKELTGFLTSIGFETNPYDVCVMNKKSSHGDASIGIYVDDILLTCSSPSIGDSIIKELEQEYKQLKITRGRTHNYLGMVLDFSLKGVVSISQSGMIEEITRSPGIDSLTLAVGKAEEHPRTPCTDNLFHFTEESPPLDQPLAKILHSITAKILFVANRARPDLLTFISFMTKRVLAPTIEDGRKLLRALKYLAHTSQLELTLGFVGAPTIRVYIDASFGVHPDRKSHTGVMSTMGIGAFYTKSTAQRLNTTSSCEAELVALAKGLQQSLWSRAFLTAQGLTIPPLQVFQDNQSTIKLVERGRPGAEQTRHIDIGYFWISDLAVRGIIHVTYCPTLQMAADFFTKPLQGSLFQSMRDIVLGYTPTQLH